MFKIIKLTMYSFDEKEYTYQFSLFIYLLNMGILKANKTGDFFLISQKKVFVNL